jgi:hypothetical protein
MMKRNILYILLGILLSVSSCYDDLGNYAYTEVEDPEVGGLEGMTFVGYVGDSLIIEPRIEHSLKGTDQLNYEWNIYNHVDLRGEYFYGPSLRMLFNLKPEIYTTKLTISNKANGMKYFYMFKIEGRTEFSTGTVVLSSDNGVGRLSFIKGGNTIQANIYEGIHQENLPRDPKQILIVDHAWLKSYHIITGEVDKPGVILDASTLIRVKYLEDNFFDSPREIKASAMALHPSGVSTGIINGKLYCGQWQTCPCSPIYGIYGGEAVGDYELSPHFNFYGSHYLGYDINEKRFIQFDINLNYIGAGYQVIPIPEGPVFDPKNMAGDLLFLKNLDAETSYAFLKEESGAVYEYKFQDVPNMFFPKLVREFSRPDLIKDNTKWQASSKYQVIYFTSDDKIYRYNPINLEVRKLDADFAGKTVSMIKLIDDDLLLAGTEGSLHYLDVSTGENGNVYRFVQNIPGSPVDVVVRSK